MERVKERLQAARKALKTLQALTDKQSLSVVERDAAIQRFEYTFEATWKAAQMLLDRMEGVVANSPKSVVRASWENELLNDVNAQAALKMCDIRNMTVHTYNEELALSVYGQIKEYTGLLETWISAMEKRITE